MGPTRYSENRVGEGLIFNEGSSDIPKYWRNEMTFHRDCLTVVRSPVFSWQDSSPPYRCTSRICSGLRWHYSEFLDCRSLWGIIDAAPPTTFGKWISLSNGGYDNNIAIYAMHPVKITTSHYLQNIVFNGSIQRRGAVQWNW